jgi:hypothetical protein
MVIFLESKALNINSFLYSGYISGFTVYMSEIIFRLAKPCDANEIANVHYHVLDKYGEGFLQK